MIIAVALCGFVFLSVAYKDGKRKGAVRAAPNPFINFSIPRRNEENPFSVEISRGFGCSPDDLYVCTRSCLN
jgi:hypothetical protein